MPADDAANRCPNCERLERRVRELEAQVEQLTAMVERLTKALEASQRAGKRQAAPFAKGPPAALPKPPGRKSGDEHGVHRHRAAPTHIDETYEAPLPKCSPGCGGRKLVQTAIVVQYQTDIPRRPIVRQFDIHVGQCGHCGQRVQGRHPLQTSDAVGAAASQLGPDAHAAIALLNKDLGLPYGKIAKLFRTLFGITMAQTTACRSLLKTAQQCEPAYQKIREDIRGSPWLVGDETRWRVNGRSAWLHDFVTDRATCYVIDAGRGHQPRRQLVSEDYSGTLIHDGWAVYDWFVQADHQQCLAHLLRRCRELLETAVGGAVRFPQVVKALLQHGLAVRDRFLEGEVRPRGLAVCAGQLTQRLRRLVTPVKTHAANERLAKFLEQHLDHIFTFLRRPGLDATNWRSEQAIRPAVVNRKVWGGNRTWRGASAQMILMSVLVTCHQQARDQLDFLHQSRTRLEPALINL